MFLWVLKRSRKGNRRAVVGKEGDLGDELLKQVRGEFQTSTTAKYFGELRLEVTELVLPCWLAARAEPALATGPAVLVVPQLVAAAARPVGPWAL
jgi:hypothetical protein